MSPELAQISAQLVWTIDGVEGLAEVVGEDGGGDGLEGRVAPTLRRGQALAEFAC
jgi:hypothetical protein